MADNPGPGIDQRSRSCAKMITLNPDAGVFPEAVTMPDTSGGRFVIVISTPLTCSPGRSSRPVFVTSEPFTRSDLSSHIGWVGAPTGPVDTAGGPPGMFGRNMTTPGAI